jgi:hypothetical protein
MKFHPPVPVLWALLLLTAGYLAGWMTASMQRAHSYPENGGTMAEVAAAAAYTPPQDDVPGVDIAELPRYPGAIRVEYRQVVEEDLLVTEVEYVVADRLEAVHDFYRDVFPAWEWFVADFGVYQGEWTFFLLSGAREAFVEIEARGELVEVEIELSEPAAGSQTDGSNR